MPPIVVLFCLIGIVFIAIFNKKRRRIIKKLRKEREAVSLDEFYIQLEDKSLSHDIVKTTYENILGFLKMKNFVFTPNESLKEVILIDKEEVKDIITDVCIKLNLRYPRSHDLEDYQTQNGEIVSIKDIILFISNFNHIHISSKTA